MGEECGGKKAAVEQHKQGAAHACACEVAAEPSSSSSAPSSKIRSLLKFGHFEKHATSMLHKNDKTSYGGNKVNELLEECQNCVSQKKGVSFQQINFNGRPGRREAPRAVVLTKLIK